MNVKEQRNFWHNAQLGVSLLHAYHSNFGLKWQGKIFGVLLAAVALWVLLR